MSTKENTTTTADKPAKSEAYTSHTPGPWKFHWETSDRDWAIITRGANSVIANVNTQTGPDATSAPATRKMPCEANARLIAAAPDLLEACKLADETAHDLAVQGDGDLRGVEITYEAWQAIKGAIEKASAQ